MNLTTANLAVMLRGKDVYTGEMYYTSNKQIEGCTRWIHISDFFADDGEVWIDLKTIQRCLGVTDEYKRLVYEGDTIMLDQTEIGGEKITGEVIFNIDTTLSRFEFGLWTKNGYMKTDFMGKIWILNG